MNHEVTICQMGTSLVVLVLIFLHLQFDFIPKEILPCGNVPDCGDVENFSRYENRGRHGTLTKQEF